MGGKELSQEQEEIDKRLRKEFDAQYKHKYQFEVAMACGGCSSAVTKKLRETLKSDSPNPDKFLGDGDFIVHHETDTAEIWTNDVEYEPVLKTIASTKKKVKSAVADGAPKDVVVT